MCASSLQLSGAEGSKYCSPYCESIPINHLSIACNCGHGECAAGETASHPYESEELRQKWVASETHQKVWPTIENTLKSKNYVVLLFDSM